MCASIFFLICLCVCVRERETVCASFFFYLSVFDMHGCSSWLVSSSRANQTLTTQFPPSLSRAIEIPPADVDVILSRLGVKAIVGQTVKLPAEP